MFHSTVIWGAGLHELDFRFETFPVGEEFLFAHHGLTLADLAETIDLARLGSYFYMVDLQQPLTLAAVVEDPAPFRECYHVAPVPHGRYLGFDLATMKQFCRNTHEDYRLDCTILGMHDGTRSGVALEALLQDWQAHPRRLPILWDGSWLHTHDNHFFWFASRSRGLLQTFIAESITGFFCHVRPHAYRPLPADLIDLVVAEYHTTPLLCFPTTCCRGNEVPADVECTEQGIRALIETAESSWIAARLDPPRHLVGRGLLIAYDFRTEAWSFEQWA